MLELRPNCECCDRDLDPASPDVFICPYGCTWCRDCAQDVLHGTCPNCGGELVRRPVRPARLLKVNPPSTTRVVRPACAPATAGCSPSPPPPPPPQPAHGPPQVRDQEPEQRRALCGGRAGRVAEHAVGADLPDTV